MAESPQPTPARRSEAHPAEERDQARELSGMANVSALTFLAARAVPLGWTVPTLALVGTVLGASVSAVDFGGAARRLGGRLRSVARRPTPILDSLLAWLANESSRLAGPEADRAAHSDAPDRSRRGSQNAPGG